MTANLPGFRVRHFRWARILRATSVMLLIWAAGILVVAGLSSSTFAGHGSLPTDFGIPALRPGDHGEYQFELVQRSIFGQSVKLHSQDAANFTVRRPEAILNETGQPWTGLRVDYSTADFVLGEHEFPLEFDNGFGGPSYLDRERFVLADPATHAAFASTSRKTFNDVFAGNGGTALADDRWLNGTSLGSEVYPAGARWVGSLELCGVLNHLQGERVSLAGDVLVFGHCRLAGVAVESARMHAVSVEQEGSRSCLTMRQADGSRERLVSVWFCSDTPVPVRIEVDNLDFQDYRSVYTLRNFSRGPEDVVVAQEPQDGQGPLTLQPLTGWGPSEAGLHHPFPLSAAIAAATNGTDAAFREFLARTPRPLLRQASYSEISSGVDVQRTWRVFVQGKHESFGGSVVQNAANLTVSMSPSEMFASDASVANFTYPSRLPSVADLFAAWAVHHPNQTGQTPNSWGISVGYDSGACIDRIGNSTMRAPWANCPLQFLLRAGIDQELRPDGSGTGTRYFGPLDDWRTEITVDTGGRVVGVSEDHRLVSVTDRSIPSSSDNAQNSPAVRMAMFRQPDFEPQPRIVWVTLAGIAVGGFVAAWPIIRRLGFLALFSRVDRPGALEHPLRAQLMDLLGENPGIHFQELVRRIGAPRSTVEHHLRKLLDLGLVNQVVANGYACYFAAGRVDRRLMKAAPWLKADAMVRVLAGIIETPGLSEAELSERAQTDAGTTSQYVQRLARLDLVRVDREGLRYRVAAKPMAEAALALARPAP